MLSITQSLSLLAPSYFVFCASHLLSCYPSLPFFLSLLLSLTFSFQSLVALSSPFFPLALSLLWYSHFPTLCLSLSSFYSISDVFAFTFTLSCGLPYLLSLPHSHCFWHVLCPFVTCFASLGCCYFLLHFPLPTLLSVILSSPLGAFPSQIHFSTLMCAVSLLLILSLSLLLALSSHCLLPLLLPKYPSLLLLLSLSLCLYHLPISLRHAFSPCCPCSRFSLQISLKGSWAGGSLPLGSHSGAGRGFLQPSEARLKEGSGEQVNRDVAGVDGVSWQFLQAELHSSSC